MYTADVIIFAVHQTSILVEISHDEYRNGNFDYIFDRLTPSKTTVSVRTKRFFVNGFRHCYTNMMETMFIVIYPIRQPVVLIKISYDESQVGSFAYIFKRSISSGAKSFDGGLHSYYGRINDHVLPCCIGISIAMSTWSLRHNLVAPRSIEN